MLDACEGRRGDAEGDPSGCTAVEVTARALLGMGVGLTGLALLTVLSLLAAAPPSSVPSVAGDRGWGSKGRGTSDPESEASRKGAEVEGEWASAIAVGSEEWSELGSDGGGG